jgi:MYXO-CTERM domain-containing protein
MLAPTPNGDDSHSSEGKREEERRAPARRWIAERDRDSAEGTPARQAEQPPAQQPTRLCHARSVILAATLVYASLLAAEPDHPGIVGGEPVDPGAWPAVVGVRTQKLCTGTLVAPDLILTAAHCFSPMPVGSISVDFGDTQNAPEFTLTSTQWGVHPDFCLPDECDGDLHDFAWIRLPVEVDVAPIVPITDQAEYDQVMAGGQEVVFVGFGQDEAQVTGIKREVATTITSFNESGREFRAGGDGNDTCFGDSGGPALVQLTDGQWRLAGVLSRGGECGEGGIYGVPMPELCWLRDSSGVSLVPNGCDDCSCVDITPERDKGCKCSAGGSDWAWSMLPMLVLLGWLRRRRPDNVG